MSCVLLKKAFYLPAEDCLMVVGNVGLPASTFANDRKRRAFMDSFVNGLDSRAAVQGLPSQYAALFDLEGYRIVFVLGEELPNEVAIRDRIDALIDEEIKP